MDKNVKFTGTVFRRSLTLKEMHFFSYEGKRGTSIQLLACVNKAESNRKDAGESVNSDEAVCIR